MGNCHNKVSNTCDGMKPLGCSEYEGNVNIDSSLEQNSCYTGQEVVEDIYEQLENLNLSALGELCLTYVTVGGKNIVKNVLLKHEEKICELEAKVLELETTDICNKVITACNLDFGTLTTQCNTQPITLVETLQLILDNLNTP